MANAAAVRSSGWVMRVPVGGSGGVELNGEGVEYGELGRAAGHRGDLL